MSTLLSDNSFGTLASGLAAGDTTLTFTTGHGARFPTVSGSDVCYVCILNSSNVLEEVIITAHAAGADTATITRAAGGTTAKVWTAGDRVEARISKTALNSVLGNYALLAGSASQAFAASTFTGNLTGNVTGDVTGNVTGSSGSCTGNAATATNATTAATVSTTVASGAVGTTQAVGTNTTAIATTAFCEAGFVNNDVGAGTVGSITMLYNNSGGVVDSDAFVGGSGFLFMYIATDGAITASGVPTGSWKNISGISCPSTKATIFQRIS